MKIKLTLLTSYLLICGGVVFANYSANLQNNLTGNSKSTASIYPNPVQRKGTIVFTLQQGSEVLIEFFDLTGKKVREVPTQFMSRGNHEIEFDATEMKSGVYLCKISTSDWIEAKRIIINH